MDPAKKEKDFILLCPGPEYLFWAIGFYFAWELSRSYRVILVADNHFHDVERVRRLITNGVLHEFIQFPIYRRSLLGIGKAYRRHKHFKWLSDELFIRYRVAAVFQHTDLEAANIYLFREAAVAGCLRVVYRPSTFAKDYYEDFLLGANWSISKSQNELGINYRLAWALFYVRRWFSHYFNFWLMPLMLTGSVFKPRINAILRPNRFFNKNPGYFDFTITYSQREKRMTEANGEPSNVVRNPLYTCGKEANDYLFSGVTERKQILILPTSGEMEHFLKHGIGSMEDKVMLYASKWSEAIGIVQKKFADWDTCIKCHPRSGNNALFGRVINFLLAKNGPIKIIGGEDGAEKFILESRVVLGTMSSALWWASELPSEKLVISLDLWGVPGGDRYSDVEKIFYSRSVRELSAHKCPACRVVAKYDADAQTLTEFTRAHVAVRSH